jgi:hypothetical protein
VTTLEDLVALVKEFPESDLYGEALGQWLEENQGMWATEARKQVTTLREQALAPRQIAEATHLMNTAKGRVPTMASYIRNHTPGLTGWFGSIIVVAGDQQPMLKLHGTHGWLAATGQGIVTVGARWVIAKHSVLTDEARAKKREANRRHRAKRKR